MKKICILFISMLFITHLYSQDHIKQNDHPGYGWLLDSVYRSGNLDVKFKDITKIVNRNTYDLELLKEKSKYNFDTQEYSLDYSVNYEYPLESDSNEKYEIWNYVYDESNTTKARLYTHHENNGYETTSYEFWQEEQWASGHKEKYFLGIQFPTYHILKYSRENETIDWQLYSEQIASFNSDSSVLFEYNYYFTDNKDTVSKSYQYYNEHLNPYLHQRLRKIDGEWIYQTQFETTYNEKNQKVQLIGYDFEDNQPIKNDLELYNYGTNGYLSSIKGYDWDEDSETWESGRKTDYINDENGNILERTKYWGWQDTLWYNDEKMINQYDDNNRIVYEEKWEADILDTNWRKLYIRTYTFYKDEPMSYLYQKWDDGINAYRDYIAYEKDFDENDRVIENRWYRTDTPPYQLELDHKTNYTYRESETQYIEESLKIDVVNLDTIAYTINYYNKYATGINEIMETEFQIHPNPGTDYIQLESDYYNSQNIYYEMYNMSGQLIKIGHLISTGIINIERLPKGQFLIKILKPNGKTETLKFQKI